MMDDEETFIPVGGVKAARPAKAKASAMAVVMAFAASYRTIYSHDTRDTPKANIDQWTL